jgi:hypothetical protein
MGRVFLVYGRLAPGGDEPLIAVVGSEDAAKRVEQRLIAEGCVVRVMWEEFPLLAADERDTDAAAEGLVIHVVSRGGFDGNARSATVDRHAHDALALNPIGLAVFEKREEALSFAHDHGDSFVQVRSLPIGWIDCGFPGQT